VTAQILYGQPSVEKIRSELQPSIEQFRKQHGIAPTLALVRVGDSPEAVWYTHVVDRAFTRCGMGFQLDVMSGDSTTDQVIERLSELARNRNVHGILLQRPLLPTIDPRVVMAAFPISKDVEGASPVNIGNLALDAGEYVPTSTPGAAIELLKYYGIPIEGKHAVVVGRSNILGKPMALMLLHANATVVVCHSHTRNLADITRQADLLIAGVRRPRFVTADMVARGAVVIDFGVNVRDNRLIGDVDFDAVKEIASAISPVPGGTGPITTMILMQNTVHAAQKQAEQMEVKSRIKWLPTLRAPKRQG